VFENILGQEAARRLSSDIEQSRLAPSMLFAGPAASGKGAAALETARILSCEQSGAPWKCDCPSCKRHRELAHSDLLVLGPKTFSPEIAACAFAYLQNTDVTSGRLLFLRAVRKLLLRFSPVLWGDDPKVRSFNPILDVINEDLEALKLTALDDSEKAPVLTPEKRQKLVDNIIKNTLKLENDCIVKTIPIAHIRNASSWLHVAGQSRKKTLVMENAEMLNDNACNSLLKILEEPPANTAIILTTTHPNAMMATILSRVRFYTFVKRTKDIETQVVRRVFRGDVQDAKASGGSIILTYLDKFLPLSRQSLVMLSIWWTACVFERSCLLIRTSGVESLDWFIGVHEKMKDSLSQNIIGEPSCDIAIVAKKVFDAAQKFEVRSTFIQFLELTLNALSENVLPNMSAAQRIGLADIWKNEIVKTVHAVEIYNSNIIMDMERLFETLSRLGAVI
jgi:DNA polymerase-3 subunit gamma/tau